MGKMRKSGAVVGRVSGGKKSRGKKLSEHLWTGRSKEAESEKQMIGPEKGTSDGREGGNRKAIPLGQRTGLSKCIKGEKKHSLCNDIKGLSEK